MTSPVVGGYYAYRVHPKDAKRLFVKGRRRERAYRVVKVWRVDDQGVWLAVFGELFTGPPVSLEASNLTTYFATLPLARRTFDGLSAECILTADVAPEETEGWEIAQREPGGFGYATVRPDELLLSMLEQGVSFPELKATDCDI